MNRLFSTLALAATAALLWQSARPAQACAYDDDYDPVRESELIVGGRLGAWEVARDISLPREFGSHDSTAVAIRVPMTVDRVFKGSSPAAIEIVDFRAVDFWQGQYSWEFGVWDCGYFASMSEPPEPGTYVILGLNRGEGGILQEQWAFFSGAQPQDHYNEVLSRLVDAGSASRPPVVLIAIGALAIPAMFLLLAAFVFPAKGARM